MELIINICQNHKTVSMVLNFSDLIGELSRHGYPTNIVGVNLVMGRLKVLISLI